MVFFNGFLLGKTPRAAAAFGARPTRQKDSDGIDQKSNFLKGTLIQMFVQQVDGVVPNLHGLRDENVMLFSNSYTKLGYAGNTEPQFIVPSCE